MPAYLLIYILVYMHVNELVGVHACMRVYALQQLVVNMLYVMYDKLLTSMNKQDVDLGTQPLMETQH